MPTFDEIKWVSFTPEQARCHVATLRNRAKVMERKLNDLDREIEYCLDAGDNNGAQELYHKKQNRLAIIAMYKEEIDRFREIFGDVVNGQSKN